jgi:gliding motility-associated-like protein
LPPEIELNNCSVFIPNVFSPNGDGLNDMFRPTFQHQRNNIDFVHIEIFNRWGNRVFVSQIVNEAWDGMFKGVLQDVGTYHYMIRYRCSGSIRIAKGEVILVR